jgi:tetraprenyl-beta-curcumene synthase
MSEHATLDCSADCRGARPDQVVLDPLDGELPRAGLDRPLAARAGVALVRANIRYWSSAAPEVHRQLARWRRRALAIEDLTLRSLALEKLARESFNAEVAATLATLVPREQQRAVVEALVALEVLFDFLDGLTEAPASAAGADGERLSKAFTDAVNPTAEDCDDYYAFHPQGNDGGYLRELVTTVRAAIATLPSAARLADLLIAAAQRSADAQLQIHAAAATGHSELERWAREQAVESPQQWRELLAGAASSVLSVHALIAAAADTRSTHEQGRQIDQAYLWISALPTILDSLVDHELDARSGHAGYVALYEDSEELAAQLSDAARTAIRHARTAPNAPHHVMTLVGVVAYYCSAPSASGAFARSATAPLMRQLRPLIGPTLAVMRLWRLTKRIAKRRGRAPTASRGRSA